MEKLITIIFYGIFFSLLGQWCGEIGLMAIIGAIIIANQ